MAITTQKYMTSFNVELTNPIFVADEVNIRNDSNRHLFLKEGVYKQTNNNVGDYIDYQMLVFANKASFEIRASGLPFRDMRGEHHQSTWGFYKNEDGFKDMTTEQAIYQHFKTKVMPSYTFTDSDVALGVLDS